MLLLIFSLTDARPSFSILAEIFIDVNRPERNREVRVHYFYDEVIDTARRIGYSVEVDIDPRDVASYQAYLLNDRQMLMVMPGQPAVERDDLRSFPTEEGTFVSDVLKASRQQHRIAVQLDEKRSKLHFLLTFPGDIVLTNSVFSPHSIDGLVQEILLPYDKHIVYLGKAMTLHRLRVAFRVSVVEEKVRYIADKVAPPSAEDALLLMYNRLNLTGGA